MLEFVTIVKMKIFLVFTHQTLRLLTNKNAYWLDGDIYEDRNYLLSKESDCKVLKIIK